MAVINAHAGFDVSLFHCFNRQNQCEQVFVCGINEYGRLGSRILNVKSPGGDWKTLKPIEINFPGIEPGELVVKGLGSALRRSLVLTDQSLFILEDYVCNS